LKSNFEPMLTQDSPTTSPAPELVILEALLETCRQTCRLNPSFDVRRAALEQEAKLEKQKAAILAKLNPSA
jgi:hypothetical protein